MHYIGVDYHKRYSYIGVKDENVKTEQKGMVTNSRKELEHFLQPYLSGKAALEATKPLGEKLIKLEFLKEAVVA